MPEEKQSRELTKFFLRKALFECLEKQNYSSLNVSTLCRQAQVGRRTFYRHYSSIEEILEEWFEEIERSYLKGAPLLAGYDPSRILPSFLPFFEPYRKELRILMRSGYDLRSVFLKSANRVFRMREQASRESVSQNWSDRHSPQSLVLFSSGGFCELWLDWIRQGIDDNADGAALTDSAEAGF